MSKTPVQQFVPFFASHHFLRKGNRFYKIQNDIAVCIVFEKPTGLLYCNFCIFPLYIPSDFFHLSFGNRLESYSWGRIPPLDLSLDLTAQQTWISNVKSCLENEIFPFFESVSSPKNLFCFLKKGYAKAKKYIACPLTEYDKLCLYTAMALGDEKSAEEYSKKLQQDICNSPFLEAVRKKEQEELEKTKLFLKQSLELQKQTVSEIIKRTLNTCF